MSPHVRHDPAASILDVAGATVQLSGRTVLEDISFGLRRGERVAVAGPNGAGKSTLFRAVAGLIPVHRGSVRVFGSGPDGHTCIAYVPQRAEVDWSFPATVSDAVMMGRVRETGWFRRPGATDRRMVRECLAAVNLTDLAGRSIGELSGGQQQRMFLARALAQNAELMLLDEPFNGLDRPAQQGLIEILNGLPARGVTLMVALHDLSLAARHFDRVLLLDRRLVAFDRPDIALAEDRLEAIFGRWTMLGGHDHPEPAAREEGT